MREVTIGIIGGFGHFVEPFQEWNAMEGPRLTGFAPGHQDENLEVLRAHPFFNKEVTEYPDAETLLEKDPPEVLVISTRLDLNAALIGAAAKAGCHVVCEKPIALNIEVLDNLQEAVRKANIRIMSMQGMRKDPVFYAARRIWRDLPQEQRRLIVANARKTYKWGTNRPEWFARRDQYGGTIPWIGIHAFDMIHYITGERFIRVMAMHGRLAHPERPDCEDHAVVLAETETGAHATLSIDYHRPVGAPGHGDDWVRLVGNGVDLRASSNLGTVELLTPNGEQRIPAKKGPPIWQRFLEHLDLPHEDELLTTDDAFHLTRICLEARDAADKQMKA